MPENSHTNRRDFLKTAGAVGITGLAGCNTLSGDGDGENPDPTETDTSTPESDYSIQALPLRYDLTDLDELPDEEIKGHDEEYVENNYSAELGVTVLNNGEEADLEELSEVHLENGEGEQIETTEDGYVPEYAVEDGQELTVRAEVEGETLEDTVTVNKELPTDYIVDARLIEEGETVYETDWNTPYRFDTHNVDRQAFLDQRAQRRNELAADQILTENDEEAFEENKETMEERGYGKKKKIESYFRNFNSAMNGRNIFEGSSANPNSFNMEKAMLDNSDYKPVFVGGFTNPREPVVPTAGDGDGIDVESQVAFVDGDWYHVGEDNGNAAHIDDIEEIGMVEEGTNFESTSASELGVSILGEFERGNTDINHPERAGRFVEEAVKSPVTLNGNFGREVNLSEDMSWSILNSIRENQAWEGVMAPMELATAIGEEAEDAAVNLEGENPSDSRIEIDRYE